MKRFQMTTRSSGLGRVVLAVLFAFVSNLSAEHGVSQIIKGEGFQVTVSTKKVGSFQGGFAKGIAQIYIKIENLSEAPLSIDHASAYLLAHTGKSLRRLSAEEAMQVFQSNFLIRNLTVQRGLSNPALIASEQQRKMLPVGDIPPKTWREGLLYFEGTGDAGSQKNSVKLFWPPLVKEGVDLNW